MRSTRPTLPGVAAPDSVAASRTYDGRDAIRRARRMANIRDVADTAILLIVDWLFVKFPSTHVPFLDREQSLMLLMFVHLIFVIFVIAVRFIPAWQARSIASTWSDTEKQRLARDRK